MHVTRLTDHHSPNSHAASVLISEPAWRQYGASSWFLTGSGYSPSLSYDTVTPNYLRIPIIIIFLFCFIYLCSNYFILGVRDCIYLYLIKQLSKLSK